MTEIDWRHVGVILGLALMTVLARSFFLFCGNPWSLPRWAQRGLHYAPIAALAAVVIPEVVTVQGALVDTWRDARLDAAAVGVFVYFWRRDVLVTVLGGMAVYLPLRLGLGW
jgi:hypothetical protein